MSVIDISKFVWRGHIIKVGDFDLYLERMSVFTAATVGISVTTPLYFDRKISKTYLLIVRANYSKLGHHILSSHSSTIRPIVASRHVGFNIPRDCIRDDRSAKRNMLGHDHVSTSL